MRTALMEMANNQLDEASKYEVKYAKSRKGPISVKSFDSLDDAKKFLSDKKKEGFNGMVSKGGKPVKESVERAAWVPESIADEQVEAFMEATVAAIAEGVDTFVFEGKSYKAKTKKESLGENVSMLNSRQMKDYKEIKALAKKDAKAALKKLMNLQNDWPMSAWDELDAWINRTFMKEGKTYGVNPKKEKLDPVGQEDDDIDNDGDVDSSDKYLKKRRSAIAKRRAMDEEKKVNEIDGAASGMRAADKQDASYTDRYSTGGKDTADMQKRRKAAIQKAADRFKKTGSYTGKKESVEEAMSGTYMTVEYDYSDDYGMLELYKNGKKVGSWSGDLDSHSSGNPLAIEATKLAKKHGVNPNGLKTVDGENPKRTGKLSPNKDFGFPVQKAKRESVEEAAGTAQHGPDSKTTETFVNMMNNGSGDIPMGKMKDFVNQHELKVGLDAEKIYQQNKYEALSKTPARMGDQSKGDKKPVNPIKVDMVDGMRKALAQMKLSGE